MSRILTPCSNSLKDFDILHTNLLSGRTLHLLAPCVSLPKFMSRILRPYSHNVTFSDILYTSLPSRRSLHMLAQSTSLPKFVFHVLSHPAALMRCISTSYVPTYLQNELYTCSHSLCPCLNTCHVC